MTRKLSLRGSHSNSSNKIYVLSVQLYEKRSKKCYDEVIGPIIPVTVYPFVCFEISPTIKKHDL